MRAIVKSEWGMGKTASDLIFGKQLNNHKVIKKSLCKFVVITSN